MQQWSVGNAEEWILQLLCIANINCSAEWMQFLVPAQCIDRNVSFISLKGLPQALALERIQERSELMIEFLRRLSCFSEVAEKMNVIMYEQFHLCSC